jgi:MarR family transcriptional regulator for hemolysin
VGNKEITEMLDLMENVCGSAAQFFMKRFKNTCAELNLSSTQARMLLFLLRGENHFSQTDICEYMETNPSFITRSIDEIEKIGLVQRIIPLENRRKHTVILTDTGQQKATLLWEKTRDIYTEFLKLLNDEEQNMLKNIFEKIGRSITE